MLRKMIFIPFLFLAFSLLMASPEAQQKIYLPTITKDAAPGLAIPPGHPRLLFSTPALLSQARLWFSTTYGAGGFTPSDPIDYAFSYLMTGNTAHAQVAIAWLMAIPHPGQDA